MLLKVKFLGHEIGYNTIKLILSKIAAFHKIPYPTGKVALMSFIGALNFYTKFIEKLHINLKPFYDFLHENTPWKWTDEHESLFQKLKLSLTSERDFTIPNTKNPFFISVDASLIGLGAVLFQINEQNKMKVTLVTTYYRTSYYRTTLVYLTHKNKNSPHLMKNFLV